MNEYITIVRRCGAYGIDSKLNGYYLPEMQVLKKRVYHGRIVYLHNKKQIGLPGLMQQNKITEKHIRNLPF
jgi:hypothetical protein